VNEVMAAAAEAEATRHSSNFALQGVAYNNQKSKPIDFNSMGFCVEFRHDRYSLCFIKYAARSTAYAWINSDFPFTFAGGSV
jgi:hypothetical protein